MTTWLACLRRAYGASGCGSICRRLAGDSARWLTGFCPAGIVPPMTLAGKRALVTGSSGGIGGAFARLLAARGASLVITGRDESKLKVLAAELEQAHGGEVLWVAADLARPGTADALFERTEGANRPVDILVNSAGVGNFAALIDRPWEHVASELQLNLTSLTALSHRFGRAMSARGSGYILNISSVVAYTPVPHFATYGAAKAYVLSFTEALAHELHPSGVRVCCLSPGSVRTTWWATAGQKKPTFAIRATMASPDQVARVGLSALFGGRRDKIVGWINRLTVCSMRLLPRRLLVALTAAFVGRPPSSDLRPGAS